MSLLLDTLIKTEKIREDQQKRTSPYLFPEETADVEPVEQVVFVEDGPLSPKWERPNLLAVFLRIVTVTLMVFVLVVGGLWMWTHRQLETTRFSMTPAKEMLAGFLPDRTVTVLPSQSQQRPPEGLQSAFAGQPTGSPGAERAAVENPSTGAIAKPLGTPISQMAGETSKLGQTSPATNTVNESVKSFAVPNPQDANETAKLGQTAPADKDSNGVVNPLGAPNTPREGKTDTLVQTAPTDKSVNRDKGAESLASPTAQHAGETTQLSQQTGLADKTKMPPIDSAVNTPMQTMTAKVDHFDSRLASIEQYIQQMSSKQTHVKGASPPAASNVAPDTANASVRNDRKKSVNVSKRTTNDAIASRLSQAFHASRKGYFSVAKVLYESVLRKEPKRRDALAGLASIAVRRNNFDEARRLYGTILVQAPQDTEALAGLISLRSASAPMLRETRIKTLIDREPDNPQLFFVLGTIYASQKRWSVAKTAFENSLQLEEHNADVPYNLAVTLDHLRDPREALRYYRLAQKLALAGPASFDTKELARRIMELSPATKSGEMHEEQNQ